MALKKPTKVREGYRQVTRPDGQQTTVRVGSTADTGYMNRELTQPTQQSTASGSLKDLSIGLANQAGVASPTKGDGSIKDLSIGLAKGNKITQEDITRAQSGGASLASLSAPTTTPTTPTSGGATGNGKSNQTGVGGSGYYSRYGLGKDEPVIDVPSYEEIEKDYTKSAQKEINSLYDYERDLLDEQRRANEQANRATASVSTLTGLAGSSEANIQQQKTTQQGTAELDKIRSAVQVKVQSVLSDVRKNAQDMYRYERTQAVTDATAKATLTEKTRANAQQDIALLAGSGVTMEGLKATDPDSYNYLAQSLGGDDMVKAMFTLNRPQDTILDKKIEGGKYIISFQNPLDGKIRIETVDLGLPQQYTKTIDAGDRILAIPDGWSGDPTELITINKGLTPTQASSGNTNGGIYDILDFRTANSVLSQAEKFNSSDIVKRFNSVQQAYNTINQVDPNSQNPAEHQAVIYDFAKALDPDSVVREGEYETIKKYAQPIFSKYKGEIENAFYGTGFLSDEAIANIKATIKNRYDAQSKQYQNKANETARTINNSAGKDVAGLVLQDYKGGVVDIDGGANQLKAPDGTVYDASELTEEEYQEALNNGYTPA